MKAVRGLCLLLTTTLWSCGQPPPATRPALPLLERPTLALRAQPEQLRIPRAALVERGGIPGVFVLMKRQTREQPLMEARFRMVRPGHPEGHQQVILAGLHGNETLVLGDLRAVRDGTPIRPLAADAGRAKP